MAKRAVKITALSLLAVVAAIVLTVVVYVIYVLAQYYRLDDNLQMEVYNGGDKIVQADGTYQIMTYNTGFGAYSPEYTFFMDTGTMKDGTETSGKYGKAMSKEDVVNNIDGSYEILQEFDCDFVFLQEVDENASRSFKINQLAKYRELEGYSSVYAQNFHSAYLFYPFFNPHGKTNAGLLTLSKYKIDSSVRRSFPIDNGLFAKILDLDRCFNVNKLNLSNGRSLTLINLHMSAYDEGGLIRAEQLKLLNEVLAEEREAGNYVIAGGDFNHDIADCGDKFPSEQKLPDWVFKLNNDDLAQGYSFAVSLNAPTCRGADIRYQKGVTFTTVIDGFIISDNINISGEGLGVENVDMDFKYSDHNPVKMKFTFVK